MWQRPLLSMPIQRHRHVFRRTYYNLQQITVAKNESPPPLLLHYLAPFVTISAMTIILSPPSHHSTAPSQMKATISSSKLINGSLMNEMKERNDSQQEEGGDTFDDNDCPICAKFSRGPCGTLFRQWLKCTDDHPGENDNGDPLHLAKCKQFATPLAECLETHNDFYSETMTTLDDANDDTTEAEFKKSWEDIATEVEKEYKRMKFPQKMVPDMEVILEKRDGAAWLHLTHTENSDKIMLAFLKDQNGTLLGAGTFEDVERYGGALRFGFLESTKMVTLFAVYGDRNEVYVTSKRLPSK